MQDCNLALPFWQSCQAHPHKEALNDGSYARVARAARQLAAWAWGKPAVAVLAGRSSASRLAVLGAAWSGSAFLPLSLHQPRARLLATLQRFRPDGILLDGAGAELLGDWEGARLDLDDAAGWPAPISSPPRPRGASDLAYVLFTSGTTGVPQGVAISCGAWKHLMDVSRDTFLVQPGDRLADNCELSFDGSLFALFLAWQAGASLQLVPSSQSLGFGPFLRQRRITGMLVLPGQIAFLERFGMLRPGHYPDLSLTLLGGETLHPQDLRKWRAAAPNSRVYHVYGATETTVLCACHLCQPGDEERPRIPLGQPLPGTRWKVLEDGQLAVTGAQLALGYWEEEGLTGQRFPELAGERWFLTGDRVQPDEQGHHYFLGRIDHQVKVRGLRLELGEVEAALRQGCGHTQVAVLQHHQGGLMAFSGQPLEEGEVRQTLAGLLPAWALPERLLVVQPWPLTPHGKVDREALRRAGA